MFNKPMKWINGSPWMIFISFMVLKIEMIVLVAMLYMLASNGDLEGNLNLIRTMDNLMRICILEGLALVLHYLYPCFHNMIYGFKLKFFKKKI